MRSATAFDLGLGLDTLGTRVADTISPTNPKGNFRVAGYEVRNLLGTTSGYTVTPSLPDTPSVPPVVGVADLMPSVPVEGGAVPVVRIVNLAANEGGASAVAEASAKPEVGMTFEGAEQPLRKVSAWIEATSDVLADAPGLAGFVDAELGRMLRIREDAQLVSGDGNAPNLLGFRSTTGVQSQAFSTSVAETIAKSLAKVENLYGVADGIAIHPDAAEVSEAAAPTYWSRLTERGINVVRTPAVGANKALIGAFGTAARLRVAELRVDFLPQHADYGVSNKVLIRAELREVLAVSVPALFVDADLA